MGVKLGEGCERLSRFQPMNVGLSIVRRTVRHEHRLGLDREDFGFHAPSPPCKVPVCIDGDIIDCDTFES